jgi:26S proteasome regulatory subunit T3
MVRDVFRLARENAPAIIFIDEVDAIGTKRFDSQTGADREVQRILLELLTQMDGFDQHTNVKVIMATNRQDTLDPALLRPGRLDRKVGGRAVWLMVLEKLWVSFVAESE